MNRKVNSAIHLVSACYWALAAALGALIGPHPSYSPFEFRTWVSALMGLTAADLLAAVRQWKSAGVGRALSIVLHFVVAILVVSLMTFEYLQAQPRSFFTWFRVDNYWFVSALAIVRLCVGSDLLLRNEDSH
jgi:hypothetical protein